MEFLKDLFGGQALTFDQLQTAAQGKGFEVVNAAGGAYVSKADADNLRSQVSALTGQLGEANKKLEDFDPEWKEKADAATQQLNQQKFDFALEKALSKSGARSGAAVRGLLNRDKLQLADDGEILGLDKQLDALKKAEDTAFLFEEQKKVSTGMSHEGGTEVTQDKKEAANEAFRSIFRK